MSERMTEVRCAAVVARLNAIAYDVAPERHHVACGSCQDSFDFLIPLVRALLAECAALRAEVTRLREERDEAVRQRDEPRAGPMPPACPNCEEVWPARLADARADAQDAIARVTRHAERALAEQAKVIKGLRGAADELAIAAWKVVQISCPCPNCDAVAAAVSEVRAALASLPSATERGEGG